MLVLSVTLRLGEVRYCMYMYEPLISMVGVDYDCNHNRLHFLCNYNRNHNQLSLTVIIIILSNHGVIVIVIIIMPL